MRIIVWDYHSLAGSHLDIPFIHLRIIICVAGLYQRFSLALITCPSLITGLVICNDFSSGPLIGHSAAHGSTSISATPRWSLKDEA